MAATNSPVRKDDRTGDLTCPECVTAGVVDYMDLVRGVSSLHCPKCDLAWKMQTEASMEYLSR